MPEAKSLSGFICYCPDLGLYHYHVSDGTDYKFTERELEDSIAAYLSTSDEVNAKTMATVTALARAAPHKVVIFDSSTGKVEVQDPPVRPKYDGGGGEPKADGGGI